MISLEEIKECYVWGTGLKAAQFYYSYKDNIKIKGFLENKETLQEKFCGFEIKHPSQDIIMSNFIVIATGKSAYLQIKKQLIDKGLKEFKSFIWSMQIGKELVVVHGNCHIAVVKEYLNASKSFCEKYSICDTPFIFSTGGGIDENFVKNCDVFIHQDIRKDNGFGEKLSDEYLIPLLKKNCKNITIPNLFGMGNLLLPQTDYHDGFNPSLGHDRNGMFPHADKIIDSFTLSGETYEYIQKHYKDDGLIEKEQIILNFNNVIDKIKQREKNWDIKVSEYILDNYQKVKLFYDIGHPTNVLMLFISLGVLKMLEIDGEQEIDVTNAISVMDGHENPVYPCVASTLGILWKEDKLRKSNLAKKLLDSMDFDEYIKEYCFWIYGQK